MPKRPWVGLYTKMFFLIFLTFHYIPAKTMTLKVEATIATRFSENVEKKKSTFLYFIFLLLNMHKMSLVL